MTELDRRPGAEAATPDQVIALIESARADLQRVEEPVEAIQLTKRADSIRYLARKADASAETQNQAAEVALRARRKAGELLAAVPRERGFAHSSQAETNATPYQSVLKEAEIPRPTAARFEQLAKIPDEQFEKHVTKTRADQQTTTAALRLGKEAGRQRQRDDNRGLVDGTAPLPADPDLRYQAIVIDPPWDWGDEGDADQLGRARPVYQTMSYDQLTALPV